jgi:hypothetical protein
MVQIEAQKLNNSIDFESKSGCKNTFRSSGKNIVLNAPINHQIIQSVQNFKTPKVQSSFPVSHGPGMY